MKIGNLDLGSGLLLAPMAEVTDAPFRKLCREHGAGLTFTQMVSARGVIENNFDTLRLLAFNREEKPLGVQVLGNDEKYLSAAVKEICRYKPDLIDLNCGCPKRNVTRYNLGAGLLDDPLRLGKLVKVMVNSAGSIPVSVKMRLGRDWSKINILDNVKAAEDNGASLVFVHARTRADKYNIPANWEMLSKIKSAVSIPVVGNGSVFTPEDAANMIKQTGVDSVLIARGALGNPFLFNRSRTLIQEGYDPGMPDIVTLRSAVFKHLTMLQNEYTGSVLLNHAKKNVIWYLRFYHGIYDLLEKALAATSIESLSEITDNHIEHLDPEETDTDQTADVEQRFRYKVLFWLAKNTASDNSCYT